jgi:hypothetical protein
LLVFHADPSREPFNACHLHVLHWQQQSTKWHFLFCSETSNSTFSVLCTMISSSDAYC